jgi:hypothetical protein
MNLHNVVVLGAAGALLCCAVNALGCGDGATATTTSSSTSTGSGGTGTGTGTGTGGGASEYATYCQAAYDRDVKCGAAMDAMQVPTCVKQEPCDDALYRDGALPSLHTCLNARACMTSDDPCFTMAATAQADTASSTAYGKACTDALAACTTAMTPFANDYCANYKLAKDGVLDQMTPCFAKPCDMVAACLNAVRDALSAPCMK